MESIERGHEVATVDGRNERRIPQWLERLRVIPVVEMPAILYQSGNRGKTAIRESRKFRYCQKSKFARGLSGIQQ